MGTLPLSHDDRRRFDSVSRRNRSGRDDQSPGEGPLSADLRRLQEEDPEAFLELVFTRINERSEAMFDVEVFVEVAVTLARDEGINLYRVLNEHPGYVETLTGETLAFDEAMVSQIDEIVEGDGG